MHTDSSTSKTDGICAFRGYSVVVPTQRVELRRSTRYPIPDGDLLVVRVERNSSRAEDARVLNFSERGMAIEIPGPAKILSEIKLLSRERNFAQVGRIRHCSPSGDVYVAGIAFSQLYRGLDPKLWLRKDKASRRVTSGAEANRFKAVLTTKQAELLRGLRNREGIAIDKTADVLDEIQLASERELVIRNLDREWKLLRSVRSALARIEEGCFGTCLRCEEEISPKRLQAVPWADYCLDCQQAADDHDFEPAESLDSLLAGY